LHSRREVEVKATDRHVLIVDPDGLESDAGTRGHEEVETLRSSAGVVVERLARDVGPRQERSQLRIGGPEFLVSAVTPTSRNSQSSPGLEFAKR
jgi:hypothetical protein